MFNEKLLRELAGIEGTGPILSVYLNVDPTQHTAEEYKLILRDMLKQVETQADAADIDVVKRYVELEYDWSGRGIILYTRQADDIWHPFVLSLPVRSGITVARKPYISPLVELDGLYGRYAVAMVDRQGAHFFAFQMGEVLAHEGFMGEEVRGSHKGGGSSRVGQRGGPDLGRKEAELVQRNLRDAAEALLSFSQKYQPRQLLLAGGERNVAQFQELLPSPLREILVGSFNADMGANELEIREQSLALLQELSEQRKKDLVEMTVTAAAKGANGVVRLGETLSMAYEGRVQVLIVERDFHQAGYRCTQCSYLTAQTINPCPFCGASFVEIPDAAEAVVTQVVEKGGTVEVVENGAMGEAHIGALLRY